MKLYEYFSAGPEVRTNKLNWPPSSQRFKPDNPPPPTHTDLSLKQHIQYVSAIVAEVKQLEQPAQFCHRLEQNVKSSTKRKFYVAKAVITPAHPFVYSRKKKREPRKPAGVARPQ